MRLKFIALLLSSLLHISFLFSQVINLEWANHIGSNFSSKCKSITTDALGNVYSIGFFYNGLDLDPGPGVYYISAYGGCDIYIQKLDADGNFVWAKNMSSFTNDAGISIAVDNIGNVYATGNFRNITNFDPGIDDYLQTSVGNTDVFVLKLDTDGNFVWAKSMGGFSNDSGNSIVVDELGYVFTTGYFNGSVDFDPGIGVTTLTSNGYEDVFVQKLDTDGNFVWAKSFGGLGYDFSNSIAVDTSGNVYSTGTFQNSVDFNSGLGQYTLTSSGYQNGFIHKLDSNGDFVWVKQIKSIGSVSSNSIGVDTSGDVYTTGSFNDTTDFDPGLGILNHIPAGANDIFIQKLNGNGDLVWIKQIGDITNAYGRSLTLDEVGNVYITGEFSGMVDFNPDVYASEILSSLNANFDAFVLKLDTSGDFIWATNMGSTNTDKGVALAVDPLNNVITTGSFNNTVDFDPGLGVFNLIAFYNNNIFIQKLSQCISTLPVPDNDSLPLLTLQCLHTTPTPPTASNGCGTTLTATSSISFPLSDSLLTKIDWNYTDASGNTITQFQFVDWVLGIDATTTTNGTTVTSNTPNSMYQWLDCNNGYTPLVGENNQSFTPSANGSYAVQIIENNCIDTSACVLFTTYGTSELTKDIAFVVYPNPSSNGYNVSFEEPLESTEILISNIQGQLVYKNTYTMVSKLYIDLNGVSKGLYFLTVQSKTSHNTVELVKH